MKIYISFLFIILSFNIIAQSSFVKVNCNNFEVDGSSFYPLVCNYLIRFTKDYNCNTYYLSPEWNYSDVHACEINGYPSTGGPDRFFF